MHHLPTGPSSPARPRRLLPRRRVGVLALLVALLVAALLAVAAPAVSGGGPVPAALDARATARTGPLVVMGVDGAPAPTRAAPTAGTTPAPLPRPAVRTAAASTPPAAVRTPAAVPGTPSASPVPVPPTSDAPSSIPAPAPAPPSTDAPTSTPSTSATPAPAPAPVTAPVTTEPARDRSDAVLAALAEARATAGCNPLVADPTLATTAGDHDAAMAADGAAAVPAGPALVAQGGTAAADVVARWLATSRGHDVLLDCTLTRLGAAELTGAGGPWWTAVLA